MVLVKNKSNVTSVLFTVLPEDTFYTEQEIENKFWKIKSTSDHIYGNTNQFTVFAPCIQVVMQKDQNIEKNILGFRRYLLQHGLITRANNCLEIDYHSYCREKNFSTFVAKEEPKNLIPLGLARQINESRLRLIESGIIKIQPDEAIALAACYSKYDWIFMVQNCYKLFAASGIDSKFHYPIMFILLKQNELCSNLDRTVEFTKDLMSVKFNA